MQYPDTYLLRYVLECLYNFFFSSRRRHTRSLCDWSSDVCSSDLTKTARCSPPCPPRSACPSPSTLSRLTRRRPCTGSFQMAVRTILPRHSMSRGKPTLTESSRGIETPLRSRFRGASGMGRAVDLLQHLVGVQGSVDAV